jgi:chromosome partitioning protein
LRVIAVTNHKGGSGKTTTCVNLAAGLGEKGRTTLVVDLDPQCSSTNWYSVPNGGRGVFGVFADEAELADLIEPTEVKGVSVIPASAWLATAEKTLAGEIGAETILRRKLERLESSLRRSSSRRPREPEAVTIGDYLQYGEKDPDKLWLAKLREAAPEERDRMQEERRQERTERARSTLYDYVLLDCPPTLGIVHINALAAAGEVLIPVEAHFMTLIGLGQLFQTVDLVRERLNPALRVTGVLPCRVDIRTRHCQEVLESLRAQYGELVYRTVIRENVKLAESPSARKPITLFEPRSAGARDYRALAEEIVAQESRG